MSKDFNATLNLPKTEFPMRAGLAAREPEMLKRWEEMDVYNELLKKNEGKPLFSLHDGPPFSNGDLHMGHALNKCLKDFIVRAAAMRGYYTPYIPGWDNHGMPIESAIIKEQKLNHETMNVADFRTAWIKVYNAHGDFNSVKQSGGGSYMKQGRDTTKEERLEIVKDCLASGKNYGEMALKYKVSYQQVRSWTLRYEEMGTAGLEDRRGKRKKDQMPRTELEAAQIEIERLKHQLYMAEMERDLLKKLDEIERRDASHK